MQQLDGAFVMEVCNDGVHGRPRPQSGMGLRLAALEAIQAGGIIEFGEREPGDLASATGGAAWASLTSTRAGWAPAAAATGGCACSSSTTTRSCTGASG